MGFNVFPFLVLHYGYQLAANYRKIILSFFLFFVFESLLGTGKQQVQLIVIIRGS